jgi:CMP-2-keto-3-deoxyoctulosonic acid synthetase
VVINVQGDEPFIRREHLEALLECFNNPDWNRKASETNVKTAPVGAAAYATNLLGIINGVMRI